MSTSNKKIYFASDFHLGVPTPEKSLEREKLVVQWLEEVRNDAEAIYLVGDIFDFWFEYKHAIPKGFVRLQGKIAELTDQGIPVHFFTGNHDMWMFGYHEKELGIKMHREPFVFEAQGKKIYIGHGDGLGPGDNGYKFIKKVFANRFFQWCFARLHPNLGIGVANYFSRSSRAATGNDDEKFLGEDQEWLAIYAKEVLKKEHIDYFVFGHRHLPLNISVGENSKYYNLGDWLKYFTYGVLENGEFQLKTYPSNQLYDFNVR
ncbi:MAG TPA: UDP-2,3-diacylglucosamine diphosphatase [Brumimicrobium sp.]|nr:UDP-2,3-diacylglucosamine diphosphatase [Brumimicrobium sp.]